MRNKLRRPLAFLLSAVMIVTMSGTPVHAVADRGQPETGLCEHHTAHTDDCGYTEETPGTPCGHEHTEDCYIEVTECVHEHTPECYPEETEDSVSDNEATPANAEEREPENCPHICDGESGCITEKLDCRHEHKVNGGEADREGGLGRDSECGYTESTPGTPCTYVCEICNPQDSGEADEEPETGIIKQEHCSCLTLCTEGQINPDCPVCGAEDAGLSDCKGKAEKEDTKQPEDTGICKHHQEHDDACGYQPESEDSEGSPCTYECRICPIEDLIATLPDKVTEDNADEVRAQLDQILALFSVLTEDEQEQIDLSRCYELQGALAPANAPMRAAEASPTLNVSRGRIFLIERDGQRKYTQVKADDWTNGDWREYTGTITITGSNTASQYASITVMAGTHDITLNNVNLTATRDDGAGFSGLYIGSSDSANVTLTLQGDNTLQGSPILVNEESSRQGVIIALNSSLTIQGNGSLRAIGGNTLRTKTGKASEGIQVLEGSLTIQDGVTVSAIGGNKGVTAGARRGFGMEIGSGGAVSVDNSHLSLDGVSAIMSNPRLTLRGPNTTLDFVPSFSSRSTNLTCDLAPGDGYYGILTAGSSRRNVGVGSGVSLSFRGSGSFAFSNQKYSLTVQEGGNGSSGGGTYIPGTAVSVNAGAKDGYAFQEWQRVSGSGSFADARQAQTTFTTDLEDTVIRPVFWPLHTLSVTGGTASETRGVTGKTVTLRVSEADIPEGQAFARWEIVSGAGTLSDPRSPISSFTFGDGDAEIRAVLVAGTVLGDFVVATGEAGGYAYADGVLTISGSGTYTVRMRTPGTTTSDRILLDGGSPTVILDGVQISHGSESAIQLAYNDKTTNATLILSGVNKLSTRGTGNAAIALWTTNPRYYKANLTITSMAGDGSTEGRLEATGANGIGHSGIQVSGAITINGGTIVATGNGSKSGINGYGIGRDGSYSGAVTINGGDVTAIGTGRAKRAFGTNPILNSDPSIQVNGTFAHRVNAGSDQNVRVYYDSQGGSSVKSVAVTPQDGEILIGGTLRFTAQVESGGNAIKSVTWSVANGAAGTSIDANGLLTVAQDETAQTLTIKATNDYSGISATASVTVRNVTLVVTQWPDATKITYGQPLSRSTLTGGAAVLRQEGQEDQDTEGSFAWEDGSQVLAAGDHNCAVTFTTQDGGLSVSGTVSVTVKPAQPKIEWTPASQTVVFTGQAAVTAPTVTLVNNEQFTGTINYSYAPGGSASYTDGLPTNAGTYAVKASIVEQGNYKAAQTETPLALTIIKADQSAPAAPTAAEENIEDNSITLDTIENAEYKRDEGEWQTSPVFTGLDPNHEYTFYVRLKGDKNHNASPSSEGKPITTKKTMLDGATVTVSGSYTYTGAAIVPAAGNVTAELNGVTIDASQYTISVTNNVNVGTSTLTVTATADGNYSGSASTTFTISPATLTIKASDQTITYGQSITEGTGQVTATGLCAGDSLSSITLAASTRNVPGGTIELSAAQIKNSSSADMTANYTITYQPGTLTINKAAAPAITWPAANGLTYGQKLSESTLSGGSTEYGSFAWKNPDTVPTAGTSGYSVTFTPSNSTEQNYEPIAIKTQDVNVTVAQAAPTVTVAVELEGNAGNRTANLTVIVTGAQNGAAPTGEITITGNGETKTLTLADGKAAHTWDVSDKEYTVTAAYSGDTNYKEANGQLTFDAAKKNQESFAISPVEAKTYGDPAFDLATTGGNGSGAVSFTSSDPSIISINGSTAAIHKAGDVTITATKAGDAAFNPATATMTISVGKKAVVFKAWNVSVRQGDAMPAFTYMPVTLAAGDRVETEPTAACTATDTNTLGTFTITFSGAALTNQDNYIINYEPGTLTITSKPLPPAKYTVTVQAGTGGTASASPTSAEKGTKITLNATPDSGYRFKEWQVISGGVTISNNSFTMPATNVTVKAVFERNSNGGGNSGGSGSGGGSPSGGGSSSGDNGSSGGSTIVARPDETKPDTPTTSQTKPAAPDKNGNVALDNGAVQSAINAAKNDAKKNGNTANGVAVVIPVSPQKGQTSFSVTIKAQTLDTLVREKVKRLEINIEGVIVEGMDAGLLKWLDTASANGDIILRVKQISQASLSKEAKAAIGTRPVYDLSLVYLSGGKETPITDFDGHTIAVRLPYAPAKDEKTGNLYAVYVDGKGKVEWLTKSSYDPDLGTVVFETGHFSIYGIGYKNPAPGNPVTSQAKPATPSHKVKKPSVPEVRSFRAKPGKKKLAFSWKKVPGAAGFQIQISTKKGFKGAKTISVSKSNKAYMKKGLKTKKKYYIRIRAYKTYLDKNKKTKRVYGKWIRISKKTR